MIQFKEEGHVYSNIDPNDDFKWMGATTLIGKLKQPFNAEEVALKCSKGKNPKYKGKSVEEILDIWDRERNRSTELGSWYHNQRESDMLQFKTITRDGLELPIVKPELNNDIKLAPNQKLENGIYPELLVYLRSAGVCGQADRVEVANGVVDVYDFKTSKKIERESYQYYDGTRKMMLAPVNHIQDCEFYHYALQLSLYMYIILKHNYNLRPGKLVIQHVKFKKEGDDENGFPIYAVDQEGNPILDEIEYIELPYLKSEIITILKWANANKEMILYKP